MPWKDKTSNNPLKSLDGLLFVRLYTYNNITGSGATNIFISNKGSSIVYM